MKFNRGFLVTFEFYETDSSCQNVSSCQNASPKTKTEGQFCCHFSCSR